MPVCVNVCVCFCLREGDCGECFFQAMGNGTQIPACLLSTSPHWACVRACLCVCVHAGVCVCVCMCVRVYVCVGGGEEFLSSLLFSSLLFSSLSVLCYCVCERVCASVCVCV